MWIVVAAAALVGASAVGASSCLVLRDETGPQAHLCTSCHGQADRPGDEVLRS
ncbi:MAG: hypothetical protein IT373_01185, partial [Polyangiaceae bacterium]|nr:hypothetical protein [Polyangiaceae bacterium]